MELCSFGRVEVQLLEDPTSDAGLQGELFQHADPSPFLHQPGDQIVEVNGIDFSNLDHKEVRCGFFTFWL